MSERHVFVADVHLRREETQKRDALIRLFSELSRPGVHLYLLGDLFNVWIGEVQLEAEPEMVPVVEAMGRLVQSGAGLTFFHGNRDYSMGDYLSREIGAETVRYWKIIELDGRKTYLNHGDLLCTADQLYHVSRWFMRNRLAVGLTRFFPLQLKYGIARSYRSISRRQDPQRHRRRHGINRAKVRRLMARGVELIICGHIHEQVDHTYRHRGRQTRVIALPPWREYGSALVYADGEFAFRRVDFT